MKFLVTMKDPDGVSISLDDAIQTIENEDNYDPEEDLTLARLKDIISEWFEYDEYLTVEIDTEEKTIKVLGA